MRLFLALVVGCFSLSLAGWLLMARVVGVVVSGYRSGRAVAG